MEFQVKVLFLTFALTVLLSFIIIPILRKLKVGQMERDDGPKSHLKKQGTPTMGGIIIILSMIIICVGLYIYYTKVRLEPEVAKNIMDANKRLADKNLKNLDDKNIFCVDFVGAIGSGKTTLVEEIIDNTDYKIGVLAGDVISKFDAGRIEKHEVPVVGLNTGKECHLDAHLVGHGLADLPLDDLDMVIIENVGNLICPVDFELGSHLRIVVVSVTEGDDTVEKHPIIFQTSDVVVINKVDLADAVGADADKMVADAKKLNPNIKIIKSSLKQGIGLDEIIGAIEEAMN